VVAKREGMPPLSARVGARVRPPRFCAVLLFMKSIDLRIRLQRVRFRERYTFPFWPLIATHLADPPMLEVPGSNPCPVAVPAAFLSLGEV